MAYQSSLSPLVIRAGKALGSVCSFSFYVTEGGVCREQHAANAHSVEVARAFILRWKQEGGEVIDLRNADGLQRAQPLASSSQRRSLRVRHRSNLSPYGVSASSLRTAAY